MDNEAAICALAALAQGTRLDVFRLLVQHEPDGLAAGDAARRLGVPHNTMSTHLALLSRAGLIQSIRRGRSIIYRADIAAIRRLVTFLLENCCGSESDTCASRVAERLCCPQD